jgi:hypothetical protein
MNVLRGCVPRSHPPTFKRIFIPNVKEKMLTQGFNPRPRNFSKDRVTLGNCADFDSRDALCLLVKQSGHLHRVVGNFLPQVIFKISQKLSGNEATLRRQLRALFADVLKVPGCSQSWTTGLFTKDFMTSLSWLIANFDVRGLGIYEVSPPLDQDNRTSKLAALIAHKFIFSTLEKG